MKTFITVGKWVLCLSAGLIVLDKVSHRFLIKSPWEMGTGAEPNKTHADEKGVPPGACLLLAQSVKAGLEAVDGSDERATHKMVLDKLGEKSWKTLQAERKIEEIRQRKLDLMNGEPVLQNILRGLPPDELSELLGSAHLDNEATPTRNSLSTDKTSSQPAELMPTSHPSPMNRVAANSTAAFEKANLEASRLNLPNAVNAAERTELERLMPGAGALLDETNAEMRALSIPETDYALRHKIFNRKIEEKRAEAAARQEDIDLKKKQLTQLLVERAARSDARRDANQKLVQDALSAFDMIEYESAVRQMDIALRAIEDPFGTAGKE